MRPGRSVRGAARRLGRAALATGLVMPFTRGTRALPLPFWAAWCDEFLGGPGSYPNGTSRLLDALDAVLLVPVIMTGGARAHEIGVGRRAPATWPPWERN